MSETITSVKEILKASLAFLHTLQPIHGRLDLAIAPVMVNEKKIWLKTPAGKSIAVDFKKVADNLLESIKRGSIYGLDDAVEEVEVWAAKLDEESRRRSLVVT